MANEKQSTNPFRIDIAENEVMGGYDVMLSVGALKDKQEAERFAEILADWMTQESGWKARIQ